MNSNKTQCILFATPNFNKRTETFQITIDETVTHMEDKVKNLGVIFDSRVSFEHHIKSFCSLLNGTVSYLNRVLKVQKCINLAAKVASNGKYLKRDHVTPLLTDLKWINFNSILQLNEASFMYKNMYVSAD